jgi:DNA mismatch repair protein MutH
MTSARRGRQQAPGCRRELEIRAAALAGRSVAEVAAALALPLPASHRRGKGFVGQLAERALGADPLAGERPDFPDLGVELKTLPVDAHGRPTESTFVCSIDMAAADTEEWERSRLRHRLACVLWLPVSAAKLGPLPARRFGEARLWAPRPETLVLLQADWEDLMGAIGAGRAGTLTAREGRVLQVRPKAANARVRTLAPGPDGPQQALPLGFYLRTAFTTAVLDGRA